MKQQGEWISIADMMSGVMMIFLLIAISYMLVAEHSKKQLREQNTELVRLNASMRQVAQNYVDLRESLYQELLREFKDDLQAWNATIMPDNTIRFKEPEVLFDTGSPIVKPEFKAILDQFFPRYIAILSRPLYKESIEEIRIEGHTSEEWLSANTLEERYLGNASLSQSRAFAVLSYCFGKESLQPLKPWLITVLRANGLSFAKPLETQGASRRVEFRTIVRTEKGMTQILDASAQGEK